MASSTGVVDMVDKNRGSRNALGRSIGAQVLWIPWVESDTTSGMGMSNWPGLPQFEFSLGISHGKLVIVVRLTRLAKTSFTANTCLFF